MKSTFPEAECAEGVFPMEPLSALLTLQVICQGQAEHDSTYENS